jgi:hypothetical protein
MQRPVQRPCVDVVVEISGRAWIWAGALLWPPGGHGAGSHGIRRWPSASRSCETGRALSATAAPTEAAGERSRCNFLLRCSNRRYGGGRFCLHNGGGPRVLSRSKTMFYLMLVLIHLAGVSSSGKLHRRTPLGALCMEIAGSDEIQSCAPIFSDRLISGGSGRETLLSVAIMGHVFFVQ